ncbi:MAG: hypothetical protein WC538_21115 [Thermoanaerobaculia bacterium]|jgi:hypothetical protein
MSILNQLVLLGLHRGGREVSNHLLPALRPRSVFLADPETGRAEAVAERWRTRGAVTEARVARLEDVTLPRGAPIVATVDRMASVAHVVEHANSDEGVFVQAVGTVGRLAGGAAPSVGIRSTVIRSRDRGAERLLWRTLADLVPPASSSEIRRPGAVASVALDRARRTTSERTAKVVLERDREIDRLLLSELAWNDQTFPMVIRASEAATDAERVEEAATVAAESMAQAVALVRSGERVDFHVFTASGRRSVLMMRLPFVRAGAPTMPRIAAGLAAREAARAEARAAALVAAAVVVSAVPMSAPVLTD